MLAAEEIATALSKNVIAVFVGEGDCAYMAGQQSTPPTNEHPLGASAELRGIPIFEDPGLPPGNFRLIEDQETLDFLLRLIGCYLTETPDGAIKSSDWWRAAT